MHVALDGEAIVGGAGAFQFDLTVPGGPVRAAGVTVVGVLPTHRRRGVLRELMRAQLDDVHERGEPLAVLWASEGAIYGRFGYGLASLCGDMEIPRAARAPSSGRSTGTGSVAARRPRGGAAALPAACTSGCGRRRRACSPARPSGGTLRVLADSEWRRGGGGELAFAVLERDGEPRGLRALPAQLLLHGRRPDREDGRDRGDGRRARRDRRRLALPARHRLDGHASRRTLLPVDHPLFLLLLDPNRMKFRVGDGLWVRLVDVGAALAARSYAGDGELVVEVARRLLPVERGPLRARRVDDDEAGPGPAPLRRRARLRLPRRFHASPTSPEPAGSRRSSDGALARADALFRTDRAPWCPEIF